MQGEARRRVRQQDTSDPQRRPETPRDTSGSQETPGDATRRPEAPGDAQKRSETPGDGQEVPRDAQRRQGISVERPGDAQTHQKREETLRRRRKPEQS